MAASFVEACFLCHWQEARIRLLDSDGTPSQLNRENLRIFGLLNFRVADRPGFQMAQQARLSESVPLVFFGNFDSEKFG